MTVGMMIGYFIAALLFAVAGRTIDRAFGTRPYVFSLTMAIFIIAMITK